MMWVTYRVLPRACWSTAFINYINLRMMDLPQPLISLWLHFNASYTLSICRLQAAFHESTLNYKIDLWKVPWQSKCRLQNRRHVETSRSLMEVVNVILCRHSLSIHRAHVQHGVCRRSTFHQCWTRLTAFYMQKVKVFVAKIWSTCKIQATVDT
jgi:hypothetical protein